VWTSSSAWKHPANSTAPKLNRAALVRNEPTCHKPKQPNHPQPRLFGCPPPRPGFKPCCGPGHRCLPCGTRRTRRHTRPVVAIYDLSSEIHHPSLEICICATWRLRDCGERGVLRSASFSSDTGPAEPESRPGLTRTNLRPTLACHTARVATATHRVSPCLDQCCCALLRSTRSVNSRRKVKRTSTASSRDSKIAKRPLAKQKTNSANSNKRKVTARCWLVVPLAFRRRQAQHTQGVETCRLQTASSNLWFCFRGQP